MALLRCRAVGIDPGTARIVPNSIGGGHRPTDEIARGIPMNLPRRKHLLGILAFFMLLCIGSLVLIVKVRAPSERTNESKASVPSDEAHAVSVKEENNRNLSETPCVATDKEHAVGVKEENKVRGGSDDAGETGRELSPIAEPALGEKEMLATRIALQRINRPDLVHGPSARERTIAHQARMQIPENELPLLSTEELVDKVAGSSFFLMVVMDPLPDGGLDNFSRSYNGVKALLARKGAGKALLDEYLRMTKRVPEGQKENDPAERVKNRSSVFRFTVIETLLASDAVLDRKSKVEKKGVISAVLDCLDARRRYDAALNEPLYGEGTLEWTALPIAKCLDRLRDPSYAAYKEKKASSGLFTKRPLTYEEAKEVIALGRRHLSAE